MDFNQTKQSVSERTETTNFEGGLAYEPDTPEMSLYKVVANNLLEDTYYEEDSDSLDKVRTAFDLCVSRGNGEFPLKLATYARHEIYLRDISQLLLVLAANRDETKRFVAEYAPDIIDRADEPCTVVAMQIELFGKPIPRPLRRGINKALHQFDKYEFAKYDNTRREVNIRDVINLTHPNPKGEHVEIFKRLMLGDLDDYPDVEPLDTPETWESVISEKGNTKEAWKSVLPRMGLFAKIRNVRNMLEVGIDGREIFGDDEMSYVKNSKIYPFRFYQAFKAIKSEGMRDKYVERWLSDAIDASADNLPDRLNNTAVAVDLSGSMRHPLSNRSKMTLKEISALFGAVLYRKGAQVIGFASGAKKINKHVDMPTLSVQDSLLNLSIGGSTNAHKAIKKVDGSVDRIIVLTDMQIWNSSGARQSKFQDTFIRYRDNNADGDVNLYMVDLSSYGDLSFPEGESGVYNISGWNSKILDFIEYAEKPRQIIGEIKSY